MHASETLREHSLGHIRIVIDAVDWCDGSHWFDDLYEVTDEHIAGTTIRIPPEFLHHNEQRKFVIGQSTPAEVAAHYAKQGRPNPSREAYESLQRELRYYMTATDCSLRVRVFANGDKVAEEYGSVGFEHSWEYGDSLEDVGREMLREFGMREEVALATQKARAHLGEIQNIILREEAIQ